MNIDIEFLDRFLQNIAAFLGDSCEIVVHDWSTDVDSTIVKIINGHVTGRTVGGCVSTLFFEQHKSEHDFRADIPVYFNVERGKMIKSTVTFIHDKEGKTIGAVALHFDITNLISAQNTLIQFIDYDSQKITPVENKEIFVRNVGELLEYYLVEAENLIGKHAADMNKEEKLKALGFLDQKGVLQITKSSLRLCDFFQISKFTLYNYLDEIRQKGEY